jgi:hypothetical protein
VTAGGFGVSFFAQETQKRRRSIGRSGFNLLKIKRKMLGERKRK